MTGAVCRGTRSEVRKFRRSCSSVAMGADELRVVPHLSRTPERLHP